MSVLLQLLRSIIGADKAAALFGDLEEEAARTGAGRLWIAAQLATYVMAAAWLVASRRTIRIGNARGMKHDVLFAVRLFRRRPSLFGLTVAGLAVAIGISTTVFSIVNAVAFASYGIAAPGSVFRIALAGSGPFSPATGNSSPYEGNWAFSDYSALKAAVSSVDVVASVTVPVEFLVDRDRDDPLWVGLMAVSGDYFQVLGLRTELGRTLTSSDDAPGLAHAVVSHAFWKNRLGSDPGIVGRAIVLGDRRFTIVGMAARTRPGPGHNMVDPPMAFWTTFATQKEMTSSLMTAG